MENKETKQCPYCGEEILAVAKKCKYCGEWLDNIETPKAQIQCPTCGEDVKDNTNIPHYEKKSALKQEEMVNTVTSESSILKDTTILPTNELGNHKRASKENTFKDFMKNKSLLYGLLILLTIHIGVELLLLFVSSTYVATAGGNYIIPLNVIAGCVMSLFIIQRVAQDRSKIDLTSLFAIGACICWAIGWYFGVDKVFDRLIDVYDYSYNDDTGELGVVTRCFFASGMLWFSISLIMDVLAKYLMWQTSKPKFKNTLLLGTISYIFFLLLILTIKFLSENILVLGFIILFIMLLTFYAMLLYKGKDEYLKKNEH